MSWKSRSLVAGLALATLAAPGTSQTIVNQFSTGGTFAGGVDAFGGVIWVVDSSLDEIQCFAGDGNPILTVPAPSATVIGAGYDPMRETLWIGDEGEFCIEVDANDGTPTGAQFDTIPDITDVSGAAVDPITGNIFISQDSAPQKIVEFDRDGNALRTIDLVGAGSSDPDGLAYNPLTGNFLTGEDSGDLILEVDQDGNLVNSFDMGALGISPEGLGLNLMDGTVYIGDGLGAMVFEVAGIIPPATTFLLHGVSPVEVPFSQDDTLRVFPITWMQPVPLGALPSAQIPTDKALMGLSSYWQVISFDPLSDPSNPVRTSNGLQFEFGGAVTPYGTGSGLELRSLEEVARPGTWTRTVVNKQ